MSFSYLLQHPSSLPAVAEEDKSSDTIPSPLPSPDAPAAPSPHEGAIEFATLKKAIVPEESSVRTNKELVALYKARRAERKLHRPKSSPLRNGDAKAIRYKSIDSKFGDLILLLRGSEDDIFRGYFRLDASEKCAVGQR